MKIINIKNVEVEDISENPLFSGGAVNTQFVLEEEFNAERLHVLMVNFAPGARNTFHTHSTEQILVVTEGKGIVATKEKEYSIEPGMIIYISPGEVHWHGATKDSRLSHLSVTGQPNVLNLVEG